MSDDYSESLVQQLLKIKRTMIELLSDRGYDTSHDEWLLTTTVGDFKSHYEQTARGNNVRFKEALSETYYKNDAIVVDKDNTLRVIFTETPGTKSKPGKIGVDIIRGINEYMEKHNIHNVIFITETQLTPDSASKIKGLPSYSIEHFMYQNLVFNVSKHFLVPKHRRMDTNEAREFLEKNNIDIDKLPIISAMDPVIRYYGGKPGQIFEISRIDVTGIAIAGTSVSHRAVRDIPLEIPTQPKKL